jgi:AcrR family transcriptional regulator
MPRTRPELNREQKADEILEAAERRLKEDGFEGLSMAGIARDLGLAQNAIYWYFPSRAELFVAVLRRTLERIASRKPRGDVDVLQRILWWTDQFAPLYAFQGAIQEQGRDSPLVAEFARQFDAIVERMLANAFRGRVADERLGLATQSFRATVTGAYAQGLSRAHRRRLLAFVFEQLLA